MAPRRAHDNAARAPDPDPTRDNEDVARTPTQKHCVDALLQERHAGTPMRKHCVGLAETAWWPWRRANTRSHPELGRENRQRP